MGWANERIGRNADEKATTTTEKNESVEKRRQENRQNKEQNEAITHFHFMRYDGVWLWADGCLFTPSKIMSVITLLPGEIGHTYIHRETGRKTLAQLNEIPKKST